MDNQLIKRNAKRKKRTLRVRKRLKGMQGKPRMCVFKSNRHLSVQIIDDENGKTLASIGTQSKSLKGSEHSKKSKGSAKILGEKIAELAKAKSIEKVIFDRGRFKYHGIIAELAVAARNAGLQF